MTIDFVQFVDEDEEIVNETELFCDEPSLEEAELYSDEPISEVIDEVIDEVIVEPEQRQEIAIKTALDEPVIQGWSHDLAMGPKIAVLGVGGAGCNALGSLVRTGFEAATMVAFNTDVQDLHLCPVQDRIVLGAELCRGRGAGGKPEVGALAAQESRAEIERHLQNIDMAFVVFGAGGGTGSGAGPEICHMAREMGCLTVAIVTKPFAEEGKRRRRNATEAFEALTRAADSTVVVANDHIDKLCNENDSVAAGFETADSVLRDAVVGMVCLAQAPATGRGKLNVDFQDVRTVMEDRQNALIGIGTASGPNRANDALNAAISSPLLEDATLEGATGVLCHIRYGSEALTLRESRQINALLTDGIDEDAEFITGFCEDPSLGDDIAVLVVATGFDMNPRVAQPTDEATQAQPAVGGVRPAKVTARAEVSADWRLGTAAERHQQRMDALAKRRAQSDYQAPPSRVAANHLDDQTIRRAAQQAELGLAPTEETTAVAAVATEASFNPPKASIEQAPEVAGFSMPAQPIAQAPQQAPVVSQPIATPAIAESHDSSAAVRRAEEGRPVRRSAVQFAAPEIDPGDNRLFGFAGTADGEPSGQYIENLTSLVPQPVAQAPAAPPQPVVAATTSQHAPFSMQQHQGAPAAPVAPVRQQMIQSEPVKLEHSGQQNLLGIDEDVDLPPFLRR
jgi:cell division protein FtsZ